MLQVKATIVSCKIMKDFFVTLAGLSFIGTAVEAAHVPTWEQLLEKWGIGFVGIALFALLARWTMLREERLQRERDARTAEEAATRKALAHELNTTQKEMLKQMNANAKRMEVLVRGSNLSADHHASALRMLIRAMNSRPCLTKLDITELDSLVDELKRHQEELKQETENDAESAS